MTRHAKRKVVVNSQHHLAEAARCERDLADPFWRPSAICLQVFREGRDAHLAAAISWASR